MNGISSLQLAPHRRTADDFVPMTVSNDCYRPLADFAHLREQTLLDARNQTFNVQANRRAAPTLAKLKPRTGPSGSAQG